MSKTTILIESVPFAHAPGTFVWSRRLGAVSYDAETMDAAARLWFLVTAFGDVPAGALLAAVQGDAPVRFDYEAGTVTIEWDRPQFPSEGVAWVGKIPATKEA